MPIRCFIDSFNAVRLNCVVPGTIMVVDECMSAWKGADFKHRADGMPHKTKIIRKPEGVGAEMKSLCCGTTGILLRLDIMEGKERQQVKKYHREYGEGTAVLCRLTEPYFGTGRTIVADSAFSSVKALVALLGYGLYFMGMVKTAHKLFPKKFIKDWSDGKLPEGLPIRGSHILLESETVTGEKFYALGWKDRSTKMVVANRGTTNPGSDSVRKRHKRVARDGQWTTIVAEKRIKRPQLIELFFQCFSCIDVHDHYRQGCLGMEREWYTHCWWHRVFGTVFGMIVVDAYLAYKYETERSYQAPESQADFNTFIDKLAHQLIFNLYLDSGTRVRTRETLEDYSETVVRYLIFIISYGANSQNYYF